MLPPHAGVRLLVVVLGATAALGLFACRAPEREGGAEVVRHGEDVLAAGGAVQVGDSVPGDAMLMGSELRFTGATGADYIGAGGSQVITGRIHGNARVAGGEIRLAGPIGRNATIAGGQIELDPAVVVGRNAYLAGGAVRVDGTVRQGLKAAGGTIILNGEIGGDADVAGQALRVGPRAVIGGALRYRVPPRAVRIDSGARIAGPITALPVQDWRAPLWFLRILWLLGFLVAGAVAVAIAPRLAEQTAERLREQPGRSAIVGLLWLLIIPVLAGLVALTGIGLPLALLTGAVSLVLVYLARAVLALWLGRRVLGLRVRPGVGGAIVGFLAGAIILVLVTQLPGIGFLVTLAATVFGLGALLVELQARRRAAVAR
jgi:hypothetical protein